MYIKSEKKVYQNQNIYDRSMSFKVLFWKPPHILNDAIINKQSSINLIWLVYAIVLQFYEKSQWWGLNVMWGGCASILSSC